MVSPESTTSNELREKLAQAHERISELEAEAARGEVNEERISQQNAFLNLVIDSLPHPFYVLDANTYRIRLANSAAAFGELTPETTCYALTHRRTFPCDGAEHLCPLQIVRDKKQPVVLEHIHYDKDGNLRNVEVHALPILDDRGNVVQMIEYSLDVTERKKIKEELENYAEKVKLFAYSISHDIKSPIVAIGGLSQLLHRRYRNALDEKAKQICDQILRTSEHVLELIEEINQYIRTKEAPLTFENIQPMEIIETMRDEFAAFLSHNRIRWSEPESIPNIKADRMSLLRVFRNLVDNAIKYGGEDLSEIKIEYEESEEFHTFSVSDDGTGIKKEDCEKIFGLFQRQQTARGPEGTGLGLAIVKEIAERHRGKAWVESESNKGTTFYIRISKIL
jgi:signal transduction histidine kinase